MPANEHALLGCPGTGKVPEGRTPANLATGPPVPREMEKNCECHYQIAIVCNCCRKGENPTKGHLRSPRPMLINLPTILLPVRALSVSFYGPLNQDLDDDCRSMSLMMRGGGVYRGRTSYSEQWKENKVIRPSFSFETKTPPLPPLSGRRPG